MVRSLQIGIRREIHRRVAGRIGKCGTLTALIEIHRRVAGQGSVVRSLPIGIRHTGELQGA